MITIKKGILCIKKTVVTMNISVKISDFNIAL